MSSSGVLRLCAADALAPGAMRRFEPVGADPILLCNVDGAFHAVEDDCTHALATLSEGELDGAVIACPLHGGRFDVITGQALRLPCKQPLRTYPVTVIDGEVWVELP
jgi:nitrite reductase/ring-hydroxylating ferredoxin subunit